MIRIFRSLGGHVELPAAGQNSWINVTQPTPAETERIQREFGMPAEIISDILDPDERPRVEFDDDFSLVILRIPVVVSNNGIPFQTIPLGVFMTSRYTVTLCGSPNEILPAELPSLYREHKEQVSDVFNFMLRLSMRSAQLYLRYLKQINQQTSAIERELVFFITSLKGNELVLFKLKNSKRYNLDETNEDLLEDAVIETRQALEMAQIYSDIQAGMMDAFASVISNNLNVVMKRLTSISIILMIPTLIASLYGMNVPNHLEGWKWYFYLILLFSLSLSALGIFLFRRRRWF